MTDFCDILCILLVCDEFIVDCVCSVVRHYIQPQTSPVDNIVGLEWRWLGSTVVVTDLWSAHYTKTDIGATIKLRLQSQLENKTKQTNQPNQSKKASLKKNDVLSLFLKREMFSSERLSAGNVFLMYTVFRKKNTHLHFLSYLHDWRVDLNKNCREYTQGTVDSENVEIRYSLRPMTSLWRHICKRL